MHCTSKVLINAKSLRVLKTKCEIQIFLDILDTFKKHRSNGMKLISYAKRKTHVCFAKSAIWLHQLYGLRQTALLVHACEHCDGDTCRIWKCRGWPHGIRMWILILDGETTCNITSTKCYVMFINN